MYSKSFEMNWQQPYRGSSFYARQMRGTLMSNNALTGASVPCLWQITYSFPFPGRPVNVLAVRSEVFKAKKKGEVDETQRMKRNHSQIHHSVSVHTTLPCSGLAFTSSCHSSGSLSSCASAMATQIHPLRLPRSHPRLQRNGIAFPVSRASF